MSRFVSPQDYLGKYSISLDQYTKKLTQQIIDQCEDSLLIDLLGCELYDLFIADLNAENEPVSDRFKKIFEPFCIDDDCEIRKSDGIPAMLRNLMVIPIKNGLQKRFSTIGALEAEAETSTKKSMSTTGTIQGYNLGVDWRESIQWVMDCQEPENYPEYNGQKVEKTSWL